MYKLNINIYLRVCLRIVLSVMLSIVFPPFVGENNAQNDRKMNLNRS